MDKSWGIHWFRRDLRVAGNPGLQWSWKEHQGRVLGVFCFDKTFLARADFSVNRFGFFLRTLEALKKELVALGGDLIVLDVGPEEAYRSLFQIIQEAKVNLPASVSWCRDYEPFARERDAKLKAIFETTYGLLTHEERDHLLLEPEELTKDTPGSFYQVYSPFAKKWFSLLKEDRIQGRIDAHRSGLEYLHSLAAGKAQPPLFSLTWYTLLAHRCPQDVLESYKAENTKRLTISLPEAGSLAALVALERFADGCVERYADQRDFPAIPGTSKLSLYFKNGSLTGAQVLNYLALRSGNPKDPSGRNIFLKELVWREFYYHILFHRPDVEKQSFLPQYREIPWENDPQLFEAWKKGETGFPIVDAGMRQLRETGWMHNRVRMIVASFLTKDLHIDWRWGEQYFMEQLLDGDLAPNNGGWQWAASTGCDPQPYFRIFNPWLQSKKFDPNGEYIQRYLPELQNLPAAMVHEPWEHRSSNLKYPKPIVEHDYQKQRALELYRVAKAPL